MLFSLCSIAFNLATLARLMMIEDVLLIQDVFQPQEPFPLFPCGLTNHNLSPWIKTMFPVVAAPTLAHLFEKEIKFASGNL